MVKDEENTKVLHSELSYILTGILFNIHNKVGRFGSERLYCDLIEEELRKHCILYKREYIIPSITNEVSHGHNKADFLIEDKIILEIKACRILEKANYYQVQRYLQASNKKLGVLVNFHTRYISPKRILNSQANS